MYMLFISYNIYLCKGKKCRIKPNIIYGIKTQYRYLKQYIINHLSYHQYAVCSISFLIAGKRPCIITNMEKVRKGMGTPGTNDVYVMRYLPEWRWSETQKEKNRSKICVAQLNGGDDSKLADSELMGMLPRRRRPHDHSLGVMVILRSSDDRSFLPHQ